MCEKNGSEVPKIFYESEGRSGYVHYLNKDSKFKLFYEFGSGSCVAIIHIPSPDNWEKQTNLTLAIRDEVLTTIGRQIVKDQTAEGSGYFKIEGNWLIIYAWKITWLQLEYY